MTRVGRTGRAMICNLPFTILDLRVTIREEMYSVLILGISTYCLDVRNLQSLVIYEYHKLVLFSTR